ncbi:MAG: hypothetical protein AAFR87_19415 [Bacteroidota bacterium]
MFEITQPTSTSSTQSRSLVAVKPPKGDSGVIRNQPTVGRYQLAIDISNEGNDHWVTNVEIILNSITPVDGAPELEFVTKDYSFENIGPGAQKEALFEIKAANPENLPQEGDRYSIEGEINYHQSGEEGQQTNPLNVDAEYDG